MRYGKKSVIIKLKLEWPGFRRPFYTEERGVDPIGMEQKSKEKILIADDSEMNRSILTDMLEDRYEIIEAEDGVKALSALQTYGTDIDLVLLDIVMPEMGGFQVLEVMNARHWIEDIPVIMISSETATSHVERAYSLGCTDFISRPFDAMVVHRRVVNTILLYAKQKKLVGMVTDQIYEKERQSGLMVDILSHIVEFRNGESAQHVVNVRTLTDLFLGRLVEKTDRYHLTRADISRITTAASLHDVGKIAIPSEIINKPGRLTQEEFAVMKTHSDIGSKMMDDLPRFYQDDPLVKVARDICRWHHERWDGRGYPDGLKGDGIPISAQIVALADVYDALTSPRVYKPAFPHEKAVEMILKGECGAFNPLLLEILTEVAPQLPEELEDRSGERTAQMEMRSVAQEMHHYEELSASERTLQLLEHERMKYSFFADLTKEIQFEYSISPSIVTISAWGAKHLGLPEVIVDPLNNEKACSLLSATDWQRLSEAVRHTTPEDPNLTYDCLIHYIDEPRWVRFVTRSTWSPEEPPQYTGVIGKAVDIHDSQLRLRKLEQMASHDPLTGLLNHSAAQEQIQARIEDAPERNYALAILDLDHFKAANDTFGHHFGDRVLTFLAEKISQGIRSGDIAARVGGDEFLIFLEYKQDPEPVIQRIYASLRGEYKGFRLSVSMGISTSEDCGTDYDTLFRTADSALYTVKRGGRGAYRFYNHTMERTLSTITPIENQTVKEER